MNRLACAALAVLLSLFSFAQENPTIPSTTAGTDTAGAPRKLDATPAARNAGPAPAAKPVSLIAVRPSGRSGGKTRHPIVHLGDTVILSVADYDKLFAEAGPDPIVLFVDGLNAKLTPIAIDGDAKRLAFQLGRTADNKDLWRPILRDPIGQPTRDLRLSIGVDTAGSKPRPSNVVVTLEKVGGGIPTVVFIAIVIAVIVLLFYYGATTDMLRNGPAVGQPKKKQAYSLGRWQMAWWFFWIVVAYIGIWLITGDRDTIAPSLLALMGISAATALGSVVIDATRTARDADRRVDLQQEKVALQATRAQLALEATPAAGAPAVDPSVNDAIAAADNRVNQINQQIVAVTQPPVTKDWLTDVLTDENGTIALHRFQILVWTVVLGIIFIFTAVNDLTMPEFNTTLLTLMGISAGTYLGFKFPGATS